LNPGNSVRQFAAAFLLFGLVGTAAIAAPITYIFSGSSVSGTLNGTPFTNAQVTITATGDTSNVPDVADCGSNPTLPCNAPLTVTFNIAGVGSGTITDSLLIFDNHTTTPVPGLGLERRSGGGDWLDIVHAQFGTYGLVTAIGPLTVAPLSTPGSFGAVATTAGNLTLTTTPGTFQATGGGAGVSPPTIAKAFGVSSIVLNASTSLTFTLHNPNASSSLTGVGFTDTLPAGLVVSTPNGLTGSCGGGTITTTAGSGTISLSGASLAGNASCTFGVNVAGATTGAKNNTTGAVTSNEGGAGGTASASVNVTSVAPPPSSTQPIPTLQEWALWLLALAMLVGGMAALRSRRRE
jgi:hypothetical protein